MKAERLTLILTIIFLSVFKTCTYKAPVLSLYTLYLTLKSCGPAMTAHGSLDPISEKSSSSSLQSFFSLVIDLKQSNPARVLMRAISVSDQSRIETKDCKNRHISAFLRKCKC
jgi:site-specific recombinase